MSKVELETDLTEQIQDIFLSCRMFVFAYFSHIYSEIRERECKAEIPEKCAVWKGKEHEHCYLCIVLTVITMEQIPAVKEKYTFTVAKLGLHLPRYKKKCCEPT